MIQFTNVFLSYLLLLIVIVIVAGGGLTLGIFLRNKKNAVKKDEIGNNMQ